MPAIPYRKTPTSTGAWDGPKQEAALKAGLSAEELSQSFAYRRADGDPKTKAAYALIHHDTVDGKAGPANMEGCRAGLQRALQVKPPLSASDMAGVRAHLVKHLSDGQRGGNDKMNAAIRAGAARGSSPVPTR